MKRIQVVSALLLFLLPLAVPAGSQESQESRFSDAVAETVIVDLVVRERGGRAVRDLRAEEIEVYEDGVQQKVTGFRLIGDSLVTGQQRPGSERSRNPEPQAARTVNLVTLVAERLSIEGRQLFRQAGLDFLKRFNPETTYVAVFIIDQRLYVVQPFTRERELLTRAVEQVASRSYSEFASQSDAIVRSLTSSGVAQEQAGTATAAIGRGNSPEGGIGSGFGQSQMDQMVASMMQFSQTLERTQQSRSSIYSLLSLVREQRVLSGRKTVIYFTEGLHVPPNLVDYFRNAISEANRANVSIYGVDARGLTTTSLMADAESALGGAAAVSRRRQQAGQGLGVSREEIFLSENAEASIRMNVQDTLADLSRSTGGSLLANTNDFDRGMEQITEDISTYYELSYSPTNRNYDGAFRSIEVKVSRPSLHVQSRSGYYALPPTDGAPVLPFEMPMLTAFSQPKPPRDFDHRSRALHFDNSVEGFRHVLAVEVPLSNFEFSEDKNNNLFTTQFAIMAVIRDNKGQVVQKFSQNYPIQGPLENLSSMRQGNAILLRYLDLPAGRYTLETASHDPSRKKISTRRQVLVVTPPASGIALSSLALIRRADPAGEEEADPSNPLRFQETKIVPNIGEPIVLGPDGKVAFYLVIYPKQAQGLPKVVFEFYREGEVVGQFQPNIPEPDERGHIPLVVAFPAGNFQPGEYRVRAVALQGESAVEESCFFTVAAAGPSQ